MRLLKERDLLLLEIDLMNNNITKDFYDATLVEFLSENRLSTRDFIAGCKIVQKYFPDYYDPQTISILLNTTAQTAKRFMNILTEKEQ
jgi:hypothetical protein